MRAATAVLFALLGLPLVAQGAKAIALPSHPLAFEANRGQTDPSVTFLARGRGYTLYLTRADAVFALQTGHGDRDRVLRMHLVGAAKPAEVAGRAPLPGRRNYYIGNNPARWHTGISTYREVYESDIYPGVDLRYHGRHGRLEYDFLVAPGADPAAVRLRFDGADAARIDRHGDLVLSVGGRQVVHHAPSAYQVIAGRRVGVQARYVRRGMSVTFRLGQYDPRRRLIIDPALNYSSYLGGLLDDQARAVAVDGSGNMYITGSTQSTDFPGKTNTESGRTDAFVTKLNSDGSIAFSTYLGSSGSVESTATSPGFEMGNAIAVTVDGKIYVTGGTAGGNSGSNLFPVVNEYHTCDTSDGDVFVSVLDQSGNLSYSTCVGGGLYEAGMGLAVDGSGNAYVVGWTSSDTPYPGNLAAVGFPIAGNAITTTKTSDPAVKAGFFFKLDPSQGTNGLLYSTYLGGAENTLAYGVALDGNGMVYITGETMCSTDFLPSSFPSLADPSNPYNAYQATNAGVRDAFVMRLDLSASSPQNVLKRFTFFGGGADDAAFGIAVSSLDRVYIAGATSSSNFPVKASNAYDSALGSGVWTRMGFVANLNLGGTGDQRIYSTLLGGHNIGGGTADNVINAIAVDPNGRAYVTGATLSSDYPTQPAVTGLTSGFAGGSHDAFVASIDGTGATLNYSAYIGGISDDQGLGIALDSANTAYVVGATSSPSSGSQPFPITPGAEQASLASAAYHDAFIAKIGLAANVGVTLNGIGTPQFNNPFTYEAIVTNFGPDTATGVSLKLQFKIKATGAPTSGLGDSPNDNFNNCTYDGPTATLTCPLGAIAAGSNAPKTVDITGTFSAAQTMTVTATVSADETDSDTSNNTDSTDSTSGVTSTSPGSPITVTSGGGGSTDPAMILMALAGILARRGRQRPCGQPPHDSRTACR